MQYYAIDHVPYVDRTGTERAFDMATAPYLSAHSAADDLKRLQRLGVVACIVPVPADMVAARRSTVPFTK